MPWPSARSTGTDLLDDVPGPRDSHGIGPRRECEHTDPRAGIRSPSLGSLSSPKSASLAKECSRALQLLGDFSRVVAGATIEDAVAVCDAGKPQFRY
jgi:hypothetical protein